MHDLHKDQLLRSPIRLQCQRRLSAIGRLRAKVHHEHLPDCLFGGESNWR
jgi:hypothetical protein